LLGSYIEPITLSLPGSEPAMVGGLSVPIEFYKMVSTKKPGLKVAFSPGFFC